MSVTCNVAEYEVLATGLNVTPMVQLPPGASELPQVEAGVSVNLAFPVPVSEMAMFESVVAPLFVSFTDLVTELFTDGLPKLRLAGLTLA